RQAARGRCRGLGEGRRRRRAGRGRGKRLMEFAPVFARRIFQRLTDGIDGALLAISLALVAVGLATLFSASYEQPARLTTQITSVAVAFIAMWVIARVPPQTLMRFAVPAYLLGLMLLVAVALMGDVVNGARRWLHVGVTR